MTLLILLHGGLTTTTSAFGPSLSLNGGLTTTTSAFGPPLTLSRLQRAPAAFVSSTSSSSSSSRVFRAEKTSTSISSSISTSSTSTSASTDAPDDNEDNDNDAIMQSLTPELRRMTKAFQAIGDDKLRYKQLLYMANQLPSMDKSSMIAPNKVPGCLSTVYIDGRATVQTVVEKDENDGLEGDNNNNNKKLLIEFTGDSDGLLTKGLVALLVRGLSNSTASAIQRIDPAFIARAGISASLTPGRNNGFLNMLAVMKRRALQLEEAAIRLQEQAAATPATDSENSSSSDALELEASTSTTIASSSTSTSTTPMYDAIIQKLQKLQPTQLVLTNVSHQHAGHAGMKDSSNTQESHFELDIVADAFDGLNLIKRHQLVYMMLSKEMPQIHALQIIRAKTPAEIAVKQEKLKLP